ncbi:MAG: protein of unknown function with transmembrane region [Candidatus Campbellbacteria bacterium GW2011_OD1_34_28]|nr:MAG: protein of unknown function with transmembrane region [Candidatus Campbellbacteria bacterium GW2011_OD1_34_28]
MEILEKIKNLPIVKILGIGILGLIFFVSCCLVF